MKKSELDTVTLPDGNRLSGYRGEGIINVVHRSRMYWEQEWLERWFLPRAGDVACVYDIGANIGNHTVYFATHSKAKVFSFEPVPVTFDLLKRNVEQNGLADRVTLFNCALGAQEGSARMQVTNELSVARITEKGTQETSIKRLDDMNLPPPDFVKIDVEDYELEVLKGMERTLRESSPVLWIEIHAGLANNTEKYELLTSLGYIPTDCVLPENIVFAKKDANAQEKVRLLFEFITKAQTNFVQERQALTARYTNSRSWKITAPLRAVRSLFRRH